METRPMKEKLPENNHDLNQLCKKALKQAGQMPDPYYLYWLQFLDWALDMSDPRLPDLPNMLDLLRRSDPKLVMDFMEKEELENGEYEEYLLADPQKEWHPVDLAWQVLDHLDSRLSASLSNYPRANPLQ